MEEDITIVKEETSDIQMVDVVELDLEDPLEFNPFERPHKRKADCLDLFYGLENKHLNSICLSIRIAIIRCFYSSSNCPTTALQMLKEEEDNDLCFTVNVEDINFLVRKFEKTGSVIGNNMDGSFVDAEGTENPHCSIETDIDNHPEFGAENMDEAEYPIINPVFLPSDVKPLKKKPSRKSQQDQEEQNEQEMNENMSSSQSLKKKIFSLQSQAKMRIEKRKESPNSVGNVVKIKKIVQRFPLLGKNQCRICKMKCPDCPSFVSHFLSHFNMTSLPINGPHKCPACQKIFEANSKLSIHLFCDCLLENCDFSQSQQTSELTVKSSLTADLCVSVDTKDNSCHSPEQSSSLQRQQKINEDLSSSQGSKRKLSKKAHRFPSLGRNICRICKIRFSDRSIYVEHFLTHFNMISLPEDGPYKCPACHKILKSNSSLSIHLLHKCLLENFEFSHNQQTLELRDNYSPTADLFTSENTTDGGGHSSEPSSSLQMGKNVQDMNENLSSSQSSKHQICSSQSKTKKKPDMKMTSPNQSEKIMKKEKFAQQFTTLDKKICRICKKKCPDVHTFTYHFLNHFNMTFLPRDGPHKCPGCHRKYRTNSNLYTHLIHNCCFEKYDLSQNHQNNDATHDLSVTVNSSSSEVPKSDGQSTSSLHVQVRQNEYIVSGSKDSSQNTDKTQYQCPRCSKILPDKKSLFYHILDHFDLSHLCGSPPYKCPECDKIFMDKRGLYMHLVKSSHKRKNIAETPFKCHLCRKAYQFEKQLEYHLLVHSGKAKLTECHYCGKEFKTNAGFYYHLMSVHAEKKAYQCDHCPRYFKSRKVLEEHKMSHSGTYSFVCEKCGKCYDTSSSYYSHIAQHKKKSERWLCNICCKEFSGIYCHKKHMRTHTGETVAVCDLCGKGFTQKSNLAIHYKSCKKKVIANDQYSEA